MLTPASVPVLELFPLHASPLSQCQLSWWFQVKPYIPCRLACPLHLPLESSYSSFTSPSGHRVHSELSKLPGILHSAEDLEMEDTLPLLMLLIISPWGTASKPKEEWVRRVLSDGVFFCFFFSYRGLEQYILEIPNSWKRRGAELTLGRPFAIVRIEKLGKQRS